jgi:hypothetical protein
MKPADAAARMEAEQARELEAYTLGVQTVIWGMQRVKAGQTLRNFAAPLPAGASALPFDPSAHGINAWGHARSLITHELRVIETPNTETLMSTAVVDLANGPLVVVHPEFGERYFRTSLWELSGDTHTISQKRDGSHPVPCALLPADWTGTVPGGMKAIRTHSRYVLVAPHIGVEGEDDLEGARAVQEGLRLVALGDWDGSRREVEPGRPMRPPRRPDTTTPTELLYFEELCETLKDVTLPDHELAFARQAERIGVTLSDGFRVERLDRAAVAGLSRAVPDAQSILEHKARTLMPVQPGGTWMVSLDLAGEDDWLFRGAVGWKHVWGDLADELIVPFARVDEHGEALSGARRYRLRFEAGEQPPSRYWRISMYDLDGFFADNPIRRYGIGTMGERPQVGADGSVTVRIQHERPTEGGAANWLPAPEGGFFLALRMYQPDRRMADGTYIVPPLRREEA